ncbi:GAF and ANTAR domain-containing protein [Amycolatopsis sp. NPDC051106]|uniref:GAF and ANTAR domain-containing protein n=1 Tax=unclassified Amycolatopsis TaxID=2618356 RepID=UPI00342D1FA4
MTDPDDDRNRAALDGEPGPLAGQFAELTARLLDAATVGEVLEQVVRAARHTVPGADLVSVTLRSPRGKYFTPVETDPVATELDRVQYETGEGPCLEASREDGPGHVHSDDLAAEPAWPRFGPRAAEHGFKAVLSTALYPFAAPEHQSGALNIYARGTAVLDDRARDTALLPATHASLALAGVSARTRAELEAENLRRAIDSRDVIGQAKGILMQRRGIGADEAFDLLRRTSQQLNVKLAELAHTLATRHAEIDLPRAGRE